MTGEALTASCVGMPISAVENIAIADGWTRDGQIFNKGTDQVVCTVHHNTDIIASATRRNPMYIIDGGWGSKVGFTDPAKAAKVVRLLMDGIPVTKVGYAADEPWTVDKALSITITVVQTPFKTAKPEEAA